MNREEFHLFEATVDLFDPSEINSASRNDGVKPLFLRVILAVRAYFRRPCYSRRRVPAYARVRRPMRPQVIPSLQGTSRRMVDHVLILCVINVCVGEIPRRASPASG